MAKEYPVVDLEEVAPEPVKEEGGWRKMDIRFVITGERQGSKDNFRWEETFRLHSIYKL